MQKTFCMEEKVQCFGIFLIMQQAHCTFGEKNNKPSTCSGVDVGESEDAPRRNRELWIPHVAIEETTRERIRLSVQPR